MNVKNWSKFQHFKDRRPPWIKLYRDILDDVEWHELDGETAKVLTMLWLIASEANGQLPCVKTLAFRLRMRVQDLEQCLSNLGHWLECDDTTISTCHQDDSNVSQKNSAAEVSVYQETEKETEKEKEKDIDAIASHPTDKLPSCPQAKLLELYKKHLGHLRQPRVWEGARSAAMRSRWAQASKPSKWSPGGYKTVLEGIEWWGSFFEYIAEDTELSKGYESAGRVWKPDLEWIVNATNFQKIIDGKYNRTKK